MRRLPVIRNAGDRKNPTPVRQQGGFTLVESLMGLFLISLALLTLMSMFTVAGRMILLGRDRTEATYLAQVMLERLTNESLSEVALYDNVDTRAEATYPGTGTPARTIVTNWQNQLQTRLKNGAYGRIDVESPMQINGVDVEGMTRTTVTVFWPIGQGRESKVELFLVRRN